MKHYCETCGALIGEMSEEAADDCGRDCDICRDSGLYSGNEMPLDLGVSYSDREP